MSYFHKWFFTFQYLRDELKDFHSFLLESKITVSDLWQLLQKYERELSKQEDHIELYPCLKKIFSDYNTETDNEDMECENEQGLPMGQEGDMPCEPIGCAPGEADYDGSPDYKNDTP